jgi:hypothetical protein
MRFLPKANPLYEKISTSQISIPDVLEKLGTGGFTGYLHHLTPEFEFYAVFANGRLLCALSCSGNQEKTGFEALAHLFATVLATGGEINVYRMTTDLAVCAHALTLGTRLINDDEVRQVDVKGILMRLKSLATHGVVRFYTPERSAMMFYKDGLPIGFYHDGSATIAATADEARKIAALPGARVEICTTRPLEELLQYDLLQMVNLRKLWESACAKNAAVHRKDSFAVAAPPTPISEQQLQELIEDISEVAAAYLSRAGRAIIEKRLKEQGGPLRLQDDTTRKIFLAMVEIDAHTLDPEARIDEMMDLIKSEMAGRLAV